MDKLVSVGWYIGDVVTGVLHGVQDVDYRSGCIQSNCVADSRVLRGVVAEDYSDTFFGIRLESQSRPLRGQPSEEIDAVYSRQISLETGVDL